MQHRYRIERQIGQGGMGAVYIATDERFGSIVAIKETLLMDSNYRKAIEREARLLNSLKHVALPRVSDHFLEENGQFLVMEYIAGEDLCHALNENNRPFPVEQVLTWADQLLDALDFLHTQAHPVIHRDIKPQNLKVTPKGQIILLDFGLAKGNPTDAAHHTAAKSIFGYSRNYASLEQIQGTGTDPRSDLYSLAATLYHLLTNTAPEDALTRAMAVLSRQRDPLVPANQIVEEIPAGVAYVLQRGMDLDAAQRPESAAVMRQMLREHEKYESYAPTVVNDHVPLSASIHAEHTKLMPGSTIQEPSPQTDVKTEVLGGALPQMTEVTSDPGAPDKKRRSSAVAIAAAVGLLIAAPLIGGTYLYYPQLFRGETIATEQPTVPEVAPVTEQVTSNGANVGVEQELAEAAANATAASNTAVTSVAANSAPKSSDPKSTTRGNEPAATAKADPNKVVDDGETIYMGNTKISDNRIETPELVIDDNGITRKTPPVPGTSAPRVVPPPQVHITPEQLRQLTPEQRKRVMRAMRRNGVTISRPPPPTN